MRSDIREGETFPDYERRRSIRPAAVPVGAPGGQPDGAPSVPRQAFARQLPRCDNPFGTRQRRVG
jgi:hypothetical protein